MLRLHYLRLLRLRACLHCTAKIGTSIGSGELVDYQRCLHFCLAILPFQVSVQGIRNTVGRPPVLAGGRERRGVRCAVCARSPEPVYGAA